MTTISNTNCRICLVKCPSSAQNYTELSTILTDLIKYQPLKDQIPSKICDACVGTLRIFQKWVFTITETDKILQKQTEIDINDDFPDPIDDPGPDWSPNPVKNVPPSFICDICGYNSGTKDRIRFHMRQKHLKVVKYNCNYCQKSYQDQISLKFHTAHTHTGDFSYNCKDCGKGFITASRLETHMAKHSTMRRFKCDICGDSFKSAQYLGTHRREVHSEKAFECSNCEKKFKCMKLLRQHQQFHRPNGFKCVVCGQSFSVGQTLRGHLKRSHPEMPVPAKGSNLRGVKSVEEFLLLCK